MRIITVRVQIAKRLKKKNKIKSAGQPVRAAAGLARIVRPGKEKSRAGPGKEETTGHRADSKDFDNFDFYHIPKNL
jgi:hypothetical protein